MTAATYHGQPATVPPRTVAYSPAFEASPFQQLGFNVLLVFLFLAFSRIFDVKFGTLHITGIAYRLVFLMVILSRGFQVALNNNIGKALLGFTIFFGLSVPFSMWRGGSKEIFVDQWLSFSFAAFLSVAGLIGTYKQWSTVFKTLSNALLVFTVIANIFGISDNGRLFLDHGKFANPNEMAQALLLGLPLWGARMALSKSPSGKVFAAGVMLLILATTFRTGSRGAMVGFAVMLVVAFFYAPIVDKLKLILASLLFLAIVTATMPGSLIARYKTIAEDDVDDAEMNLLMQDSAVASAQSRKQLLWHSLLFTLQHPIFGVGPGMFAVADDEYMKSQGHRKGAWVGTHNSYTEVSSELGIPAFLCFVAAVWMALKGPYVIYRKTRGDPRLKDMGSMALALHYCLVIYAVTIIFDHIAYTIMLPVFAGLVAALIRTSNVEIERIRATPVPVSTPPAMFQNYRPKRPGIVTPAT